MYCYSRGYYYSKVFPASHVTSSRHTIRSFSTEFTIWCLLPKLSQQYKTGLFPKLIPIMSRWYGELIGRTVPPKTHFVTNIYFLNNINYYCFLWILTKNAPFLYQYLRKWDTIGILQILHFMDMFKWSGTLYTLFSYKTIIFIKSPSHLIWWLTF